MRYQVFEERTVKTTSEIFKESDVFKESDAMRQSDGLAAAAAVVGGERADAARGAAAWEACRALACMGGRIETDRGSS